MLRFFGLGLLVVSLVGNAQAALILEMTGPNNSTFSGAGQTIPTLFAPATFTVRVRENNPGVFGLSGNELLRSVGFRIQANSNVVALAFQGAAPTGGTSGNTGGNQFLQVVNNAFGTGGTGTSLQAAAANAINLATFTVSPIGLNGTNVVLSLVDTSAGDLLSFRTSDAGAAAANWVPKDAEVFPNGGTGPGLGGTSSSSVTFTAVPEPSTIGLLAFAATSLVVGSRFRRKK